MESMGRGRPGLRGLGFQQSVEEGNMELLGRPRDVLAIASTWDTPVMVRARDSWLIDEIATRNFCQVIDGGTIRNAARGDLKGG